jgi:hypothetical protein
MNIIDHLNRCRGEQFVALILDNEVTVTEFVAPTPLPWTRLIQENALFKIAEGYPTKLTVAQARFEMKNWDEVSVPALLRELPGLSSAIDYVVIGNNAGQGLPLAQAIPENLRAAQTGIIYAVDLPQQRAYEQLGCRNFYRRSETAGRLSALAERAGKSLSFYFINTIQHNESNYYEPK